MSYKDVVDITVERYSWTCLGCGNTQTDRHGLLPDLTCQVCGCNFARGKITNEQNTTSGHEQSVEGRAGSYYTIFDESQTL